MVRLFVVLGFALLAGGAYAIVDGWPYRVLERGFTEVILGGLAAVAGLILLALSAVLAEIRRLKGLVSGAMAAVVLSEPRADERPRSSEALARPEPSLEKAPMRESGSVGITTTLAAGAGAAAVAGALTGLATSADARDETASGKAEEVGKAEEREVARPDDAEVVVAEPSQPPSIEAGEADDWLLPPLSPVLDAAPSEVRPDERGENDQADEQADTSQEDEDHPVLTGLDEASHPEGEPDHKKDDGVASTSTPEDEPVAAKPDGEGDAAKPETAPASSPEDQLWWPRIEPPARRDAGSVEDEFSALRDQLVGAVNTPEVEAPRRHGDVPDIAESWKTSRPWPPVTQPRDPGALGDAEAEIADKDLPEDAKAEPVAADAEPEAPEPEPVPAALAEAEAESAKEAELPMAATKPDEEPAASDEGVIGAYQVGETQFTMFADGSIHARTPDGDYTFASMDELKAYLASEKDKLESSSN